MEFAINCSLALNHIDLYERPKMAKELGFRALEYWWPFEEQRPDRGSVARFLSSIQEAEQSVKLFNFPGGGEAVEDRGLLAVTGKEDDFFHSAEVALSIGAALGVQMYNPMTGNVAGEWRTDCQAFETAVQNLVRICPMVAEAGGIVVLEPLSGFPHAALKTYRQTAELVVAAREAGCGNVGILLDLYHLAINRDTESLSTMDIDLVSHVQIADAPGRGWPGSGDLPLRQWINTLQEAGYRGAYGMECSGAPMTLAELAENLGCV